MSEETELTNPSLEETGLESAVDIENPPMEDDAQATTSRPTAAGAMDESIINPLLEDDSMASYGESALENPPP